MMIWNRLFVACLALFLFGCNSSSVKPEHPSEESPVSSVDTEQLLNRDWRLISVSGKALAGKSDATVRFSDRGVVTGSGGCNKFRGGYRLTDKGIEVSELTTTRKLCFTAIMYQEQQLLRALRRAERMVISEQGELMLYSGELVSPSVLAPVPSS